METNKNYAEKCPITGRPYFMEIWLDGVGYVPTYGGPFDSYTIPIPDDSCHPEERAYYVHRFCHDRGEWVDDETIYLEETPPNQ